MIAKSNPALSFVLYNENGNVRRSENQPPKQSGKDPLQFTYWLRDGADYYVQEKPIAGYTITYVNTEASGHADVTDCCYNGGTIINSKIPKTDDSGKPIIWAAIGGAALTMLLLLLHVIRRKRFEKKPNGSC